MKQKLHELLESEEPVALRNIERALASQDNLTSDQEAVLSALVWRRCTNGGVSLLGTVLYQDCASRIGELPQHLEAIGAHEAASAVTALREEIPLEDERIKRGLMDWVETQSDVAVRARELGSELDPIDDKVWDFLKHHSSDIPDIEVTSGLQNIVSSFAGWFQSETRKE